MNIFKGAFTALITPLNKDGSVDYEGFRKNVKYQLDNILKNEGILTANMNSTMEDYKKYEDSRGKITELLASVESYKKKISNTIVFGILSELTFVIKDLITKYYS